MAWGLGNHDHTEEIDRFEKKFKKKYQNYWCIKCGKKMSQYTIRRTEGCSLPMHLKHFKDYE